MPLPCFAAWIFSASSKSAGTPKIIAVVSAGDFRQAVDRKPIPINLGAQSLQRFHFHFGLGAAEMGTAKIIRFEVFILVQKTPEERIGVHFKHFACHAKTPRGIWNRHGKCAVIIQTPKNAPQTKPSPRLSEPLPQRMTQPGSQSSINEKFHRRSQENLTKVNLRTSRQFQKDKMQAEDCKKKLNLGGEFSTIRPVGSDAKHVRRRNKFHLGIGRRRGLGEFGFVQDSFSNHGFCHCLAGAGDAVGFGFATRRYFFTFPG